MKKQDYDKLYKRLEKEKNPEKALKIADEIITNRPYFKNPYVYVHRIKSIEAIMLKKYKNDIHKLSISKTYRKVVKENLDNYLLSYYMNVDKATPTIEWKEWYGEDEVIYSLLEWYPEKDRWKFIKFLKMSFDRDITEKAYLFGSGDNCDNTLVRLLNIYYYHGEDKNKLNQLEAHYYTYSGFKKYNADFNPQDKSELEEMEECKADLEKALRYGPDNPMANFGLGRFFYEIEGNPDKAVKYLHKAEANFILIWDVYYYLGKIYAEKKDYEKAKNYYKYALSLYDEDGKDELIEEMVEDLSMIGGCRQELLESLEQKPIQEEKTTSPNIKIFKTNKHLLDDKTKEECETHLKSFKEEFPKALWNSLDKYSQQLLSCAETAYYCGSKSIEYFRPSFANAYLYYFQALENEILTKTFMPYKTEQWRRTSEEEKQLLSKTWFDANNEKDKRRADNMRNFVKFFSDKEHPKKKIERPTLGQMLGMLSLGPSNNPVVKKAVDFILYTAPILGDQRFFAELDSIKEERNKIHGIVDIEKSFISHFQHFRDAIIGTKGEKGLLVRFLEAVEPK